MPRGARAFPFKVTLNNILLDGKAYHTRMSWKFIIWMLIDLLNWKERKSKLRAKSFEKLMSYLQFLKVLPSGLSWNKTSMQSSVTLKMPRYQHLLGSILFWSVFISRNHWNQFINCFRLLLGSPPPISRI